MNESIYKLTNSAGSKDQRLDSYFDLEVYNNLANNLTKIVLLTNEEFIYSIEFFIDNTSTGVFKGSADVKSLTKTEFVLEEDEYISQVYGSFSEYFISSLYFKTNKERECGFTSPNLEGNAYFKFENEKCKIISLNMAFGKYLKFVSPNYMSLNYDLVVQRDNLFLTKVLGKKFNDSINFEYNDELNQYGEINKIVVYHDDSFVKGIKITYGTKEIPIYKNVSHQNIKAEILELEQNEIIDFISIRCGDLIDNITITTNKGKSISAGGIGGGMTVFDLNKIKSQIKKDKLKFCGFSGGYVNNMNYLYLNLSI